MGRYFILRDGDVSEEPDYSRWAEWYESCYEQVRCVAQTELEHGVVTTDFLGMAMGLSRATPPLVFETRVRGGWLDDESERYATLEEAVKGHEMWTQRACQMR